MQSFPTVLIPFDGALADSVDGWLDENMGNPAGAAVKPKLDELGVVHFMSITAVRGGEAGRAVLVIEASVDGDSRAALRDIAEALHDPLLGLLRVAGVGVRGACLAEFLIERDHAVGPGPDLGLGTRALGLCFPGTPGLSVERIRREDGLARHVRDTMKGILAEDRGALSKLGRVRAKLWEEGVLEAGDSKWAFVAEPLPWLDAGAPPEPADPRASVARASAWLLLAFLVLAWLAGWMAAAVVLAAAAGAVAAVAALLRRLERTDVPDDATPDHGRVAEAMARENLGAQNLLVSVTDAKSGWLRRLALRGAFLVIGRMAAKTFRPGFLADLGTIHFARWVLLPGTAGKLVFLSNYDGSLESYLEDFIQRASQGVTAIWSNTKGFPRARWLYMDGARDGDRFRRFVLRSRVPVRFWYSAYPELTTGRIRANAAMCHGIAASATDDEAEAWLARFGAFGKAEAPAPRRAGGRPPRATLPAVLERLAGETPPAPRVPLEEAKIPTLVFGARRHLRHSACLMVRMEGRPADCRAWLAGLEPEVTYGAQKRDQALALALTARALGPGRLGLDAEDLATFPPPFRNGMDAPCRARALGDEGSNAPGRWSWGNERNPVDALVVAYDSDPDSLERRLRGLERDAAAKRHRVAHRLRFAPLPPRGEEVKEPFGFVDGVSQPLIRGAGGKHGACGAAGEALQEPGEFVLGYRDNSGYLPPSPTVAAGHDPSDLLGGGPVRGPDGRRRRDLGRNGTYVAVRQLAQDVDAWAAWRREAAREVGRGGTSLAAVPACVIERVIEAKLVGRWLNGSALAQHAAAPGQSRRNDFLYGDLDPSGLACPLGAHARRANPRDSLDPGSATQLSITDRHRILRVGRHYDAPPWSGERPGLLFMALNADLDRQFEFVQQTWLLGRSFHGLEDEDDPLLGQGRPGGAARTFTVHTGQGPVRLRAPKDLVAVKGGGYFFMPGRDALRFLAHREPAAV